MQAILTDCLLFLQKSRVGNGSILTIMEFKTLRTYQNYFTAHIMLTKLRQAGIECFLNDEFTVTIDPILSNAVGGIKLVVKTEDAAEVEKIIESFEEAYRKNAVCPKCGGNSIVLVAKKNTPNLLTILLSWLFSGYAVSAQGIYECEDCHHQMESLPEPFNYEPFLESEYLEKNN